MRPPIREYADSDDPIKRQLADKQRTAAFTRKAIATRRARGLRTSQLEQRLAALLHEVDMLRAQLPAARPEADAR